MDGATLWARVRRALRMLWWRLVWLGPCLRQEGIYSTPLASGDRVLAGPAITATTGTA